MKRKILAQKFLAFALTASVVAGMSPTSAFAVTGSQVAADGTYTSTAHVTRTEDDSDDEWNEYDVKVSLTVKDGKFSDISVTPENGYDSDNDSYFNKAYTKTKGFKTKVEGQDATADTISNWDTVSGATRTSSAIKSAALAALDSASEKKDEVADEYVYCYAGLTWSEYWAAEGVQAAGSTASSDEVDSHGESDKGAFDTVTRATANHGLHRGSFQCNAVVETEEGKTLNLSYWKTVKGDDGNDKQIAVMTDGTEYTYNRGVFTNDSVTLNLKDYKVTGLKFVPVKVKAEDYEAFKAKYTVYENGSELKGGYGENNLQVIDEVANVTADTNGLKTATKNADGSFSFSARATGTDSGVKDTSLKKADGLEPVVKEANGSYGEFLRVDFNGNYGDLGANMQAVKWTYYGNDSTRTKALATYGT